MSHAIYVAEAMLRKRYPEPRKVARAFQNLEPEHHHSGPFRLGVVGCKPRHPLLRVTEQEPAFHGIFLHGGPGSNVPKSMACAFNITRGCVWVPEQRRAHAVPLAENTTDHLVEDTRRFMDAFGIRQAVFYGSSWGATLALAFAVKYPQRVSGIVGTSLTLPDVGQRTAQPLLPLPSETHRAFYYATVALTPPEERKDMLASYYRRFQYAYAYLAEYGEAAFLQSPHANVVRIWMAYNLTLDDVRERNMFEPIAALDRQLAYHCARGLLQLHYLNHGFFLPPDWETQLQTKVAGRIPVTLLYGEHDYITHATHSAHIAQACGAKVVNVMGAGHLSDHPQFIHHIVTELEVFTG